MRLHHTPRGITLIETILYIALLGLLLSVVIETMYLLLRSQEGSDAASATYIEGSFVVRKLAWALADMEEAPLFSGSGCSGVIAVKKTNYPDNPVTFKRDEVIQTIEMSERGGEMLPITSPNTKAACLSFTKISASGATPAGVIATVTLDDQEFTIMRYVRR